MSSLIGKDQQSVSMCAHTEMKKNAGYPTDIIIKTFHSGN